MEKFFDAHTHVQFAAYDDDREKVISRAKDDGVRFINIGTQKDTSRRAVELAERHKGVFAAVGLHPVHTGKSYHDADELGLPVRSSPSGSRGPFRLQTENSSSKYSPSIPSSEVLDFRSKNPRDIQAPTSDRQSGGGEWAKGFTSRGEVFDAAYYRELALHPKTLAIGECGLDYFHFSDNESRDEQIKKQKDAFLAQIALAAEIKKPLMIHCREAFTELINILRSASLPENPGIIHFFTGTVSEAQELLNLGFSFTFGGAITFPPRKRETENYYHGLIRMIPAEKIFSETDAPYVAPVPHRGKRNEPAFVVDVVKKLAELKNVSVDEMAAQIRENVKRVFMI